MKPVITNDIFWLIEKDKGMAASKSFQSNLMIALVTKIRDNKWDNQEASKQLKVSEKWIESLTKGKMHKITIHSLIKALVRVGIRVTPKLESL
jgi:predicted XRE-type DNA-binding protein